MATRRLANSGGLAIVERLPDRVSRRLTPLEREAEVDRLTEIVCAYTRLDRESVRALLAAQTGWRG